MMWPKTDGWLIGTAKLDIFGERWSPAKAEAWNFGKSAPFSCTGYAGLDMRRRLRATVRNGNLHWLYGARNCHVHDVADPAGVTLAPKTRLATSVSSNTEIWLSLGPSVSNIRALFLDENVAKARRGHTSVAAQGDAHFA
jgi:hypothetical protein